MQRFEYRAVVRDGRPCVGGARKSRVLPGKGRESVSTAYVLPLTHLLAAKPGMELA